MMFLSVAVLVVDGQGVGVRNQPAMVDITGGDKIDIAKVPWQVFLNFTNEKRCGGIIISDRWILTAAHCMFRIEPSQIQLRVGSNLTDYGGKVYEVETVSYP